MGDVRLAVMDHGRAPNCGEPGDLHDFEDVVTKGQITFLATRAVIAKVMNSAVKREQWWNWVGLRRKAVLERRRERGMQV